MFFSRHITHLTHITDIYRPRLHPQYMSHHKDIRTSESVESRYIDNQT